MFKNKKIISDYIITKRYKHNVHGNNRNLFDALLKKLNISDTECTAYYGIEDDIPKSLLEQIITTLPDYKKYNTCEIDYFKESDNRQSQYIIFYNKNKSEEDNNVA